MARALPGWPGKLRCGGHGGPLRPPGRGTVTILIAEDRGPEAAQRRPVGRAAGPACLAERLQHRDVTAVGTREDSHRPTRHCEWECRRRYAEVLQEPCPSATFGDPSQGVPSEGQWDTASEGVARE